MKSIKAAVCAALFLASGVSMATSFQSYAEVLDVHPNYVSMNQPVQVCNQGYAPAPQQQSSMGGLIGGVLGGLAGHQVGHGQGNTAATIAGALGGAYLGNEIANQQQANAGPQYVPTQNCGMQDHWVQVQQGYRVTYRFAGRTFTENMSYAPGDHVRVHASVGIAG